MGLRPGWQVRYGPCWSKGRERQVSWNRTVEHSRPRGGGDGRLSRLEDNVPAPTEIVAAPIATPIPDTPSPAVTLPTFGGPVAPVPAPRVESKPISKPPVRTKVVGTTREAAPTTSASQ